MIKSLQQARRFLTILFGFTLLVLGVLMLVLPGPGLVTIALALGILAAEYVWARRLLDRLKQQGDRLRNSIFQREKPPVSENGRSPASPAGPLAARTAQTAQPSSSALYPAADSPDASKTAPDAVPVAPVSPEDSEAETAEQTR
jgi:Putative transmembrane protein (PGPGW)